MSETIPAVKAPSNWWILRLRIKGLAPVKKQFLEADFKYFAAGIMNDFHNILDDIKNNRKLLGKIVNHAKSRQGLTGMTVELLQTQMEGLADSEIKYIDTKVYADGDDMVAEAWFDEYYFLVMGGMRKTLYHVPMGRLSTKEGVRKAIENRTKAEYTKDFTTEESQLTE